jgi:tetratricopeptide (TPR) repeat protein
MEPHCGNDMKLTKKEIIAEVEKRFQAKRYDDALDLCNYGIAKHPTSGILHRAKAKLLQTMGRFREAIKSYTLLTEANNTLAEDFYNRGMCHNELQKYEEAIADQTAALKVDPNYYMSHMQRGAALWELRRWDEALEDFKAAKAIKPDDPNSNWILGLLALQMGDFKTGWPNYATRWQSERFKSPRLATDKPEWTKTSGAKSVLVWGEQGIGDQVIYASLLPAVRALSKQVTAMVEPRLIPLFSRSMPDIEFIPNNSQVPADKHDAQIPFASLGASLIGELRDIPTYAKRNFLKPDPERVVELRKELGIANGEFVVGISWVSAAIKIGPHKSMTLTDMLPILSMEGVRFVNLQYGHVKQDIADFEEKSGIKILQSSVDNWKDLDGLAALCSVCDVIVSISSSTVHMAGGIGVPVMLMDANKLWYWGNKDSEGHSLWYPSVKIFPRGNVIAPWKPQIEAVAYEIHTMKNRS